MISVGRLAPGDQYDQHLLDRLFANTLYPTGMEFSRVEGYPNASSCILLVPGRYWAGHEAEVNEAVSRYSWLLMVVTSDEESTFDCGKIDHSNVRFWIQTPRVGRDYRPARFIPLGSPPYFDALPSEPPARNLDVFLAAQDTHSRRHEAFAALQSGERRRIEPTPGFTQGMDPAEYVRCMTATKAAPAPSGAVSPDSFRVYEALEAHAVPIADDVSPAYDSRGYWEWLFPGCPFPVLRNYSDLPGYVDDVLVDWPRSANRITAWWIAEKRRLAQALRDDLTALSAPIADSRSPITVVMTISPVRSHPDTSILEETVASIRERLPLSEIVLAFDGVRSEQEDLRGAYEEHIRRVLWLADHEWGNVLPLITDEHLHQAVATKRALEHVRTPLMLFCEHDTPLCGDQIDWSACIDLIEAGAADVVRYSHESEILPDHQHMVVPGGPLGFVRTCQWSQRPHLTSVAYYRRILASHFSENARCFIEDVMHSVCHQTYLVDGVNGWNQHRLVYFHPEGNIKRSRHLDGRDGEPKHDDTQVF